MRVEPTHLGPPPLTVVQILPALESGGVERGTLEVAAALARAGHRSIVVSTGGRLVEQLRDEGSEHVELAVSRKSPWTLTRAPALRRLLRECGADILHARSRMPGWVAWRAWQGMAGERRPSFVTTVHGLYSVSRYSSVMTRGERVIVGSQTVRDYVLRSYPGTEPERLVLIPRGISRTAFPYHYRPDAAWLSAWRARFPQLAGHRIITLAGRLTRLKGHQDLLALLERLQGRGVHALVVGPEDPRRGRYARSLRAAAAERRLPVTFTGQRDDIREIYAVSDLVLSLSRRPESFGRTVLEALSLGVPVVGYAHGGVGEILGSIYPEGLVPVGDLGALVARVESLLVAPTAVPEEHPFTLDGMLRETIDTYLSLRAGDPT
jgi:glycosyltransferase involved in cell wall biosynthesis